MNECDVSRKKSLLTLLHRKFFIVAKVPMFFAAVFALACATGLAQAQSKDTVIVVPEFKELKELKVLVPALAGLSAEQKKILLEKVAALAGRCTEKSLNDLNNSLSFHGEGESGASLYACDAEGRKIAVMILLTEVLYQGLFIWVQLHMHGDFSLKNPLTSAIAVVPSAYILAKVIAWWARRGDLHSALTWKDLWAYELIGFGLLRILGLAGVFAADGAMDGALSDTGISIGTLSGLVSVLPAMYFYNKSARAAKDYTVRLEHVQAKVQTLIAQYQAQAS